MTASSLLRPAFFNSAGGRPAPPESVGLALAPQGHEWAISARQITLNYAGDRQSVPILKGIDFAVQRGQVEFLMGPSGSGKTSLLSILAGILTPTSGSVRLLGCEITQLSRRHLAKFRLDNVGFVFQGFNLFPALTAAENVELALRLKGIRGKNARSISHQLLDRVGLGHRSAARPRDLSGGEKQRVALARALAEKPSLILADEPTAALDAHSGRLVMELLRSLAKEDGATVVVVTHDPRILDLADHVAYLEDGRLSETSVAA